MTLSWLFRCALHFYKRVSPSVRPSVGRSVGHAFAFRPFRSDLWPCIRPCFNLIHHFRNLEKNALPTNESTDEPTDGPTNRPTDRPSHGDARTQKFRLKSEPDWREGCDFPASNQHVYMWIWIFHLILLISVFRIQWNFALRDFMGLAYFFP